jgi:hypothetical protein
MKVIITSQASVVYDGKVLDGRNRFVACMPPNIASESRLPG